MFMNEYEIRDAVGRFDPIHTPNLYRAAVALFRLMHWTNNNSDGWPYWKKPTRAANRLMTLIERADRFDPEDITEVELKKALTPIKSFLTRQEALLAEVLVRDDDGHLYL